MLKNVSSWDTVNSLTLCVLVGHKLIKTALLYYEQLRKSKNVFLYATLSQAEGGKTMQLNISVLELKQCCSKSQDQDRVLLLNGCLVQLKKSFLRPRFTWYRQN